MQFMVLKIKLKIQNFKELFDFLMIYIIIFLNQKRKKICILSYFKILEFKVIIYNLC